MKEKKVKIGYLEENGADYMARAVQVANRFGSKIYLEYEEKRVNMKSIMGMMGLGAREGAQVVIRTEGEDETEALEAIETFLTD